jgi:hypothetical protein
MMDNTHILHDGTVTASGYGLVDAAAVVLNLGSGLTRMNVILNISAIKISADNEIYTVHVQAGNNASFTKSLSLCSKELGHNSVLQGSLDSKISKIVLGCQNEHAGTVYPYIRIRFVVAGSSPSITLSAFLHESLPERGWTTWATTTT